MVTEKEEGGSFVEEVLRVHREKALKILKENRAQSRDGIELLVKERLGAIAGAARQGGGQMTPQEAEALYRQVLELSYTMFALGYSVANALAEESVTSR